MRIFREIWKKKNNSNQRATDIKIYLKCKAAVIKMEFYDADQQIRVKSTIPVGNDGGPVVKQLGTGVRLHLGLNPFSTSP